MSVQLEWQDPPQRTGGTGAQYDQVIATLKQHPGRWARVLKDWRTSSGPAAFRQQGCEMTTRRNADRKNWSVYARWPMPKTQPAPKEKAAVQRAVATGTALTPPPPVMPKKAAAPAPANDFGIGKFRADREARGVPPEGRR